MCLRDKVPKLQSNCDLKDLGTQVLCHLGTHGKKWFNKYKEVYNPINDMV